MKLLKRLGFLLILIAALCCVATAVDYTADDLDSLYAILWENYRAQNEAFSVEYTGSVDDLMDSQGRVYSCAALTRMMNAAIPCTNGRGPDIQMMNLNSGVCLLSDRTLKFSVTYLLDHEKLAFMEDKAAEIAASLGVSNASDYRKVKAVYEYMTTNFLYDTTLSKFTDYDGVTSGTMVCQGYALLTYRLLWELDIPCRIITGTSMGQPHGWNLVRVNGRWYAMDTTWDSKTEKQGMSWNYFLHTPEYFADHSAAEPFAAEAFRLAHPFAESDYPVPTVSILVDGEMFGSLIIRNGRTIRLTAAVEPEIDAFLLWTSSDPDVVSIDQDGNLQSLKPGAVTITASVAGDDRYIPGTFPVTAVDTSTCSDWAYDELNSYYMRTLYPAEFCSDYQSPITRAEFAHLIYLMLGKYWPTSGSFVVPPFEDIEDSPYWLGIIYTSCRRIFAGTGETTFSPNASLTREQAAKVLCLVLEHMQIELPEADPVSFTDAADISLWANEFVQSATAAGLFRGDANGAFHPREAVTREQAAVLLERLVVEYVEPLLASEAA